MQNRRKTKRRYLLYFVPVYAADTRRQIGNLVDITPQGAMIVGQRSIPAGLADYFTQYPGYAKYYNLRLGPDLKPDARRLELVARERVLIKLQTA